MTEEDGETAKTENQREQKFGEEMDTISDDDRVPERGEMRHQVMKHQADKGDEERRRKSRRTGGDETSSDETSSKQRSQGETKKE